jgi:hypothetical protein
MLRRVREVIVWRFHTSFCSRSQDLSLVGPVVAGVGEAGCKYQLGYMYCSITPRQAPRFNPLKPCQLHINVASVHLEVIASRCGPPVHTFSIRMDRPGFDPG